MSAFHPNRPLRQPVDRLGQFYVALGHSAGVVGPQAEVDLVPVAGELRVMVHHLRMQRDARQEAERL